MGRARAFNAITGVTSWNERRWLMPWQEALPSFLQNPKKEFWSGGRNEFVRLSTSDLWTLVGRCQSTLGRNCVQGLVSQLLICILIGQHRSLIHWLKLHCLHCELALWHKKSSTEFDKSDVLPWLSSHRWLFIITKKLRENRMTITDIT